jgi:F0F1-type ATP synthase assembly protein I
MPEDPPPIPDSLKEQPKQDAPQRSKTASAVTGLGELSKALAIGIDFLAMIAAGGFLGWLLDKWQGWSPTSLVIGVAIGFVWGTVRLIRRLNKM